MSTYDFGEQDDAAIATLARAMQNIGMLTLAGGVFVLLRQLYTSLALAHVGQPGLAALSFVAAVLQLVIAALLIGSGRVLMVIPRTEGDDIPTLMTGLRRLTWMYVLQSVAVLVLLTMVAWIAMVVIR